jgi:exosortase A
MVQILMMSEIEVQHDGADKQLWKLPCSGLGLLILLLFYLYRDGISSAVSLWAHTGAYNHCFLIIPIFFYLTWSNRAELGGCTPRVCPVGIAVILLFSGLWLLASQAGIAEGTHFAIVGVLQGVILTVLGWRIYLRFLLPFSYLWLLVPSGTFAIPTLQTITAKGSAALLAMTGIPTYLGGFTIDIPSGSYVVAPGCAGLNFVLASLATSAAFAELIYRSWPRRLAFIGALLLLAVVGNILRVYLIIAIAHATNNIGNIVDDHLLYGWGFFSLLLLASMWIGQRFRQDLGPDRPLPPTRAGKRDEGVGTLAILAVLTVAAMAAGPLAANLLWPPTNAPKAAMPSLACGPFAPIETANRKTPAVGIVDGFASVDCDVDGHRLQLEVAWLDRPVREGKLWGLEQRIGSSEAWTSIKTTVETVTVNGQSVPVGIDLQSRGSRQRTVWSLFWADRAWRAPGLATMVADLAAQLKGRRHAALVRLSTDFDGDTAATTTLLTTLLAGQSLDSLAGGNAAVQ